MNKILLIHILLVISLQTFSQKGNPFPYIDSENLYIISIPKAMEPCPLLTQDQELNLRIKNSSSKKGEASYLSLSTFKVDTSVKLEDYLLLKLMFIIKDSCNHNISGTTIYSTSKYEGQSVEFDRITECCSNKVRVVYIKNGNHIYEFFFTADLKEYSKQIKFIDSVINTFSVYKKTCTDASIAKTGRFRDKDSQNPNQYIVRTDSTSIEYFDSENYIKSKIVWNNTCTYSAHIIESKINFELPFKNSDILTVTILNTNKTWFDCIWEINDMKGYAEYIKIE